MKNIDKFGYLIISITWIFIAMLEKKAHEPIETIVIPAFVCMVLGWGVYWYTLKRSNLLTALGAGMFWPLYLIYYLFGRSKGGQSGGAVDRPKVGAFMSGLTGTDKKVICQNCGCRLKKGMMGGWSAIMGDSNCVKQGKKCVPQESLL